jgi:2-keto-4-pentenoate hydratase/2-oxohepta-3-ene-1,7-dioic acid hydratase in catechol pathway
MRFAAYRQDDVQGLAVWKNDAWHGAPDMPSLDRLLSEGRSALADAHGRLWDRGTRLDPARIAFLPPFANPAKIICVGLNYADHSAESGFATPSYPAIFTRVASSLIGHGAPIIRPRVSDQLDYEGELVAVIGRGGRHIPTASALDHVAGYSIFNDASVRDYQMKSTQWTVGKNFDGTGSFGPCLVTADELPSGAGGLRLQTRLNGTVVQDASTDDMIFDVASLIQILSEAVTLAPGDVIVTGTPAGVGLARKPQLWMKPGDICEVEIEGIGILANPIEDETA